MNSNFESPYIIIGAGGHGAVIADILRKRGYSILGFLDDGVAAGAEILGYKVLGEISLCKNYPEATFIIGIGDNSIRKKVAQAYPVKYGSAIHPSAIIGSGSKIGRGSVVMAGSVINSGTVVGEHCIINTRSSLDHDNRVGDFVHVSPGVTTGGDVVIGENCHVGIGSVIKNGITICGDVTIGAGAVVVKDIVDNDTYIGVPAVPMGGKPKLRAL